MSMYSVLFEDEDDIFAGSPRSKFFDVIYNANRDLCKVELENIMRRMAALELLAEECYGDNVDSKLKETELHKADECAMLEKSLYMDFVGQVVSQE